jgi:hypothetical protein
MSESSPPYKRGVHIPCIEIHQESIQQRSPETTRATRGSPPFQI